MIKNRIAGGLFLLSAAFISLISIPAMAQPGCPTVNAGPDVTVGCGNNCTTLTATVVPTGATTSYAVQSIPYTPPFPFTGGTSIIVNTDDVWSSSIALPFTFCFYGGNYNSIVVGSNGVISFDVSQAGGFNQWSFSASCPSSSLPMNAIFGVYQDTDPTYQGVINYRISGTYPCRMFVISYYQIPYYGDPNSVSPGSCNSAMYATSQIVIYESTNVIEVYIQNKALCSGWNGGNGLVGIQNSGGTQGLAPPGRNTGQWTAQNEAWRFYPNGAGGVDITWWDGATQIGTGASIQVCPNATTTYTAQAVYNTCTGSNVTATDQVTVNYNATFSISVNPTSATICPGDQVTITASGPGNVNFTWTPATGLNTTTGTTVVATPNVTTTYTVTGVDPTNCSMSLPVTITVTPNPVVSITPSSTTVCPGMPVDLTASGAATYTWSGAGLVSTSGQTVTANPTTTTTYYVTGSSGSCSGTASVTINMSPSLNITISPPGASICLGNSVDLIASGADTYVWSPGSSLSSTTGDTVTATPTTTTTYYVTGTANGCTGQASAVVDLNGSLVISVSPPNPGMCFGESVDMTASGALTYTWSPPDYLSSTSGATVTASPPVTTTYTVHGADASNCQGTTLVTIMVSTGPVMTFNPPDPVICRGESVDITVFGGTSYTWSPSAGLSSTTGSTVTAAPFTTMSYTVLGDNYGCTGVATIEVEVKSSPQIDFTADVFEGCEDLLVSFTDLTNPPSVSWSWDFGDGSTPNAFTNIPNPQHLFTESGYYDISLTVTSVDGCHAHLSIPQMIHVLKSPVADFVPNPQEAWIYDPTINFFDYSINTDSWSWDFGEPWMLDNYSNLPSPSHTYSDTGYYTVMLAVESPDGCVDTMIKTIYIHPNIAIYIPNAFTPNNDGKNDIFQVFGEGIDENRFLMRIFERWGAEIYFSKDIHQGWNGMMDGTEKKLPAGIYPYFISFYDIKGKYHEYTGHINLVR